MTDPLRMAWLAGALDYNNSIRMAKRHNRLVPIIQVTNTDKDHIRQFTLTFGGAMATRGNGMFVFQRSHIHAVDVVRKIRPYILLNGKVADEVLDWLPEVAAPKLPSPKVPCPNQCGNQMTPGSKTCMACYNESSRISRVPAVVTATKPDDPKQRRTGMGTGEVTQTPTGQIHRMRG